MSGDITKTFNLLITAVMLVIVLIACEKMPEEQTSGEQVNYHLIDNS